MSCLHRAHPICAELGSRAQFFLLTYRSSLIEGKPSEVYRGPWDQLRAACPQWPGFRPERCSPQLARALWWEQRLQRLFPDLVCTLVALLLAVPLFPLFFAIPIGVHISALDIEHEPYSVWCWIGFGLQAAGIIFWECFSRLGEYVGRVEGKWRTPDASRWNIDLLVMRGFGTIGLPLCTVLFFVPLMDSGVHFRACCYVYLLYAAAELPILVLRWKSGTTAEVLFLKWGWAPIITLGLPLLLPTFKALGWINVFR
jgi:hypothetical protein